MMVLHQRFQALERADMAGERLTTTRRKLAVARQKGDPEGIRKALAAVTNAERSYSAARLHLAQLDGR